MGNGAVGVVAPKTRDKMVEDLKISEGVEEDLNILNCLDGLAIVMAAEGEVVYVSHSVYHYLGISVVSQVLISIEKIWKALRFGHY